MTAAPFTVNAKPRTAAGKGGARSVRAEGSIPAIAYGRDLEAMSLSVAPKDILTVLASEHGQNSVLELSVEGAKKLLVMIKEYSYHPLKRNLLHVDFVEVKLDRPVDVEIPLFTTGKAEGVTKGGLLRQVFRTLPVRCLPDRIPLKIEVDVTALMLGDAIAVQDVKLAEGVEVLLPAEQTIVAVVAPEKDRTEETAAAPGAPGAAPAAGTAPAAGAAKDAKAAAPAAGAAKDAKKK